jgi:hypothetical protein
MGAKVVVVAMRDGASVKGLSAMAGAGGLGSAAMGETSTGTAADGFDSFIRIAA